MISNNMIIHYTSGDNVNLERIRVKTHVITRGKNNFQYECSPVRHNISHRNVAVEPEKLFCSD